MSTGLMIAPKSYAGFTPEDAQLIKDSVLPPGTAESDLKLFLAQSKRTGLDPLSRQIYGFKQGAKLVIGVTIDGSRVVAERSGKYAGQLGPFWCGKDGVWKEVWLDKEAPLAAKVGVIRSDFKEVLWAVAKLDAYKPPFQSPVWTKMPEHMLAKCAEMLALRKAFPNDLSGLYGKEELGIEEVEVVAGESRALPQAEDEAEKRPNKGISKTRHKESSGQKQVDQSAIPASERGRIIISGTTVTVSEGPEVKTSTEGERGTALDDVETVTKEELMDLLNTGIRNGFDEETISTYLEATYDKTEENILELTKAQLAEAKEFFSRKK